MQTRFNRYLRALLMLLLMPVCTTAEPLFDAHLHYNSADAEELSPQDIMRRFDDNGIRYAAVTGTPQKYVDALYRFAPERIVPLLSVYRGEGDKNTWSSDVSLPAYVERQLERGHWAGIGELHIFAGDRHSPVFASIIRIAAHRRLPLLIHGDPAVIDTVYEIAPQQPVIWAHAGTFPYPDLVADYLRRYPGLSIDLSMRDERIAPLGLLDDAWYELLVSYPQRFMVGVDSYSLSRWQDYDAAVKTINNWLAQLPDDVAAQLGYANAALLFKKTE